MLHYRSSNFTTIDNTNTSIVVDISDDEIWKNINLTIELTKTISKIKDLCYQIVR